MSGAREYPQAPLDDADRETPERRDVRCACVGDACAYRFVGCWGAARPLGEGQIVVLRRGHDVGERRCLPTGARRVRNPHRSSPIPCSNREQEKERKSLSYGIGREERELSVSLGIKLDKKPQPPHLPPTPTPTYTPTLRPTQPSHSPSLSPLPVPAATPATY
eukprot:scaffold10374_cov121-Isochrysis_galbana.AAC.4